VKPPSPGQFSLCAHALTVDGNRTPQPFLTGLLSCVRQRSTTSSRKRGGACQGRLIERSGGCGRRVAAVRAERLDRRRVGPARRPATASVDPTDALRRVRAPLEGRAPSRRDYRAAQAGSRLQTRGARGTTAWPGIGNAARCRRWNSKASASSAGRFNCDRPRSRRRDMFAGVDGAPTAAARHCTAGKIPAE